MIELWNAVAANLNEDFRPVLALAITVAGVWVVRYSNRKDREATNRGDRYSSL